MARRSIPALLLALSSSLLALAAAASARGLTADASASTTAERRGRITLSRGYSPAALADAVDPSALPGIGPTRPLDFPLFAGYVRVDEGGEADGTSARETDNGRALYYVLAESADAPENPQALILWLNGGPGCSSVGGGLLSEQGPFFPRRLPAPAPSSGNDNTTTAQFALDRNPHAWNRGGTNASVIFLESPAYVGFSYSNTTLDAEVGDVRTAKDAATFLRRFVERFPKYKNVPLYVSGESYAGHYVPTLAAEVLRVNKIVAEKEEEKAAGSGESGASGESGETRAAAALAAVAAPATALPLRGFLLGNPWTDASTDNMGALDYWYAHAMISKETHDEVAAKCDMSTAGPLAARSKKLVSQFFFRAGKKAAAAGEEGEGEGGANASADAEDEAACDDALGKAWREMGRINIYSIYKPVCREPGAAYEGMDDDEESNEQGGPFAEDDSVLAAEAAAASPSSSFSSSPPPRSPMASQPAHESSSISNDRPGPAPGGRDRKRRYDPCIGDEVEAFLNDERVQRALHADPSAGAIAGGSRGPDPETGEPGWSDCTGRIDYSRSDLLSSMLPLYARLTGARGAEVAAGGEEGGADAATTPTAAADEEEPGGAAGRWAQEALQAVAQGKATPEQVVRAGWLQAAAASSLRMWVYSGDTDGIVPVLGTRRWVEGMGLPVSKSWRAWKDGDSQVGGRRVDFASPKAVGGGGAAANAAASAGNATTPPAAATTTTPSSFPSLSFVTVRNSGHMVPYDSPQRGQQLLLDFLSEAPEAGATTRRGKAKKGADGAAAAAAAAAPSQPPPQQERQV